MKGDFSNWRFNPLNNDQGLLFQQGRVSLDSDLTEAGLVELAWRTQAGRDVIGASVAAVPADEPNGFRIQSAVVQDAAVQLAVLPGRIWADGQLLYLPPDPAAPAAPLARVAPYLDPPANPAGTGTDSVGDGVRDAVVLEFTLEELNGFQAPERLIEPALGGPDTAERIAVRQGLRLLRLAPGENCDNIRQRLADGPTGKGRLTASLLPPDEPDEECPVVSGGGYSGFEHNLYRVEIADTDNGATHFKWSRFNGGLVGRGQFRTDGGTGTVTITANRTAIINSGFASFYLEALRYDQELGHWRVSYGTPATLNGDQDLELADPPVFGVFPSPPADETVFFRLWDNLEPLADYTDFADPKELADGIHLAFDAPASASYRPGDYWTFAVRAGEIANAPILVDARTPDGPIYRRVPLAEIEWTAAQDTTESGKIEDCRRRFNPLTRQKVCCTLLVGDGLSSFGDFNSVEEAAGHLPPGGGELCLLPGLHFANLALSGRRNIRLRGCPHRTWLLARLATPDQPILSFTDCVDIGVSGLDLVSFAGTAIVADATQSGVARAFAVEDCRILARTHCIRVNRLSDVNLSRNRVWLIDTAAGEAAVFLRVTDGLVERNHVGVWPRQEPPPGNGGPDGGTDTTPDDPCAEPDILYANLPAVLGRVYQVWAAVLQSPPPQPYRAWGGIQVRGGSERVRLLENQVDGGAGHGITLGGRLPSEFVPQPSSGTTPEVTLDERGMTGVVQDESGQGLSGIDVYLSQNGAVQHQGQSADQGGFTIAAVGSYTVSVEPGYEIAEMREVVYNFAAFSLTLYVLVVRQAAVEGVEDQAHLYRLLVRENEIQRMALSGIGFMPYAVIPQAPVLPTGADPLDAQVAILNYLFGPRDLIGTCNVVQDLEIRGNRLHDNLLAVFNDLLRLAARTIGQGGISLALVENAVIADNHIHDNGISAVSPVCGIFIGYAEDLELSGNRISGNGMLTEDYASARIEGLRGGIFVRLASAFLLGGETDAFQKPALRITNNRIDQPAGRAVTAFAFGPVACDANHFNSEREGRWGLLDSLIGTVLLINLGGIHRQLLFSAPAKASAPTPETGAAAGIEITRGSRASAFADVQIGEGLLPGGETLYNSNQVRMGPNNRAYMSQLLVTLDDLGFDGNQSSIFRQDVLFANTVCIAHTVRATDNRLRERNLVGFLSLWSYAFGLTNTSRQLTMNTTAHNQGEHCIIAMSTPNPTVAVVDDNNLELLSAFCKKNAHGDNAGAYIRNALIVSYLAENAPSYADATTKPQTVTTQVLGTLQSVNSAYRYGAQREASRMQSTYGSDSTRAQAAKDRLVRNAASLGQLRLHAELAGIEEPEVPANGTVLDGRVTDAGSRGKEGLTVEFVRADGTSLGITAKTDASGYFAVPVDAEQTNALTKEKGVYLKVSDARGQVLQQTKEAMKVVAGTPLRAEVVLPTTLVPRSALAAGTVVFNRASTVRTSTPLENVRGIGKVTADRLRAAGIRDLETLARTEASKLVEIAGFDISVVKAEAEAALGSSPRAATAAPKRAARAKSAAPTGSKPKPKGKDAKPKK